MINRTFSQPASTWKGAYLRAMTWSGVHLCGSFVVSQAIPKPWHNGAQFALLLGVGPAILGLVYRSWRVALASMTVAAGVLILAFGFVWVVIKTAV